MSAEADQADLELTTKEAVASAATADEEAKKTKTKLTSRGSSTSTTSSKLSSLSVSSAPPFSSNSFSELSSVSTSESSADYSKMSTTSSLGLAAKGEAAPPLGAKNEEVVRGIPFKVSHISSYGAIASALDLARNECACNLGKKQ